MSTSISKKDRCEVWTPRLKTLRPVLKSWIEAVAFYCGEADFSDNPWWFNERATLSTLAGAAWRTPGWIALEEYLTLKLRRGIAPEGGIDEGQEAKKHVPGRVDLYLANRNAQFIIEGKQAWQSVATSMSQECDGEANHLVDRIRTAINSAWDDTNWLIRNDGEIRVAAVFVAPNFKTIYAEKQGAKWVNFQHERIQVEIDSWLKKQKAIWKLKLDIDAYAYYFPYYDKSISEKNDKQYPGVALLLQRRLRST